MVLPTASFDTLPHTVEAVYREIEEQINYIHKVLCYYQESCLIYRSLNVLEGCSEKTLKLLSRAVELGNKVLIIVCAMLDLVDDLFEKDDFELFEEQKKLCAPSEHAYYTSLFEWLESFECDKLSLLGGVSTELGKVRTVSEQLTALFEKKKNEEKKE